ncbi:hypothetical protein AVEN_171295-1 [Araneus ventricosus]|uniref:Uncharacterized protein n=1 Tax=Araneus ventricosus TaxID=182803 RepID=A0A4Y2KJE7_ARAVE|nr:hypothetical protein AVEN_171295-1 [Araneus ventricosus]
MFSHLRSWLQRVGYPKKNKQAKDSFSFILKKYVDYVKKNFNEGATIAFYDYPEDAAKISKDGFVVKQAQEDANYLIIKSALEIEKKSSQCVVVVGEDIDLLVMMTASTNSENIFFLKPERVTTHKEPAPPALLSMISCKCAKVCNLTCTCRKSGIKCSTICYHCKMQGCTNFPEDGNIVTNSANQEVEIDIRMQEKISEVEEECETLQVEKVTVSKPILMMTHFQDLKNVN